MSHSETPDHESEADASPVGGAAASVSQTLLQAAADADTFEAFLKVLLEVEVQTIGAHYGAVWMAGASKPAPALELLPRVTEAAAPVWRRARRA